MNTSPPYTSPSDFFDVKKAKCLGVEIVKFYPDNNLRGKMGFRASAEGISICKTCEVIEQCLNYAVRFEPLGVWGGTGEIEREMIRRERSIRLPENRGQSESVRRSVRRGIMDRNMRIRRQRETA